jgi:hypothetical protein
MDEQLQCCGYFGVSDAEIGGSFCANATFVQTTIADDTNFCVGPITAYSDGSLNLAFTYVACIFCNGYAPDVSCFCRTVRPQCSSIRVLMY